MTFHSLFELNYLWLPLIGFIVGFCGAVIGGGGGFFFLPVLILLFDVPAQVAVPTSLAATIPVCIAGSVAHHRKNNLHLPTGIIFAVAGVFGAMSGAGITSLITETQLQISFGVYSILMALQMLFGLWKENRAKTKGERLKPLKKSTLYLRGSLYGFLGGIITGTFGTSGIAPVMAGMFSLRMPLKLVIGTSLIVVCANTLSALGAHFMVGEIDLTLVYFLTVGTIIGALTGPVVLAGVKLDNAESPVRKWFALAMIAFGVVMIVTK